tara:strand:- start:328 stop:495 length:168 start_codon:yes stop_codon:yes gene_type:complete
VSGRFRPLREHPNGDGAALPDPGDRAAGHVTADCVVAAKDGALAPVRSIANIFGI